ncbi:MULTISPECIES: DUF4259 domain-containing protein [Actinomycetes]|uniref:DUF4259 domain-containing protein n=1 Tax=Actinomycetes TaxID=1760 RepID=UPI00336A852E
MHIWGTGVFDNAPAVEWADQFDRTAAVGRPALVRSALETAVRADDQHAWLVALGAATSCGRLTRRPAPRGERRPEVSDRLPISTFSGAGCCCTECAGTVHSVHTEWTRLWTRAALLDDAVAVVEAVIEELEERTAQTVRVREAS